MTNGVKTIIYPVHDLEAAKPIYTALFGVEPAQDTPYYVGYRVGDQDLGLDPNGHRKGMTGSVGYLDVDDIAAAVAGAVAAGAELVDDAKDVGGGKLIALVKDKSGNLIGLAQNPA
jgi:predicted enzyme related to lactoylglutathione lyase